MDIYSSHSDIIDQVILPLLGDFAADFDVEAIADELAEWRDVYTADGSIDLTRSGLTLKPEFDDAAVLSEMLDRHNLA